MNLTGKTLVPVNLLQRQGTRMFLRKLAEAGVPNGAQLAVMFWHEFGTQEKVWLALHHPAVDGVVPETDPTFLLLEEGVGWTGEAGRLVLLAVGCGWLRVTKQGDASGVELDGFAEMNEHLVPGHKTMQQKGQIAMAAKAKKSDTAQAAQQRQLIEMQGRLGFDSTPKELEMACALIIRIDRIAKRTPRPTSEYDDRLIEAAVKIRREHTPQEIDTLLTWLVHQRGKATVLQGADAVVPAWAEYTERARVREGEEPA